MATLSDYRTADPYEAAAIRCAEASARLWALSAEERVSAMRRGELSLHQPLRVGASAPRGGAAPRGRVRVHRADDARGRRGRLSDPAPC